MARATRRWMWVCVWLAATAAALAQAPEPLAFARREPRSTVTALIASAAPEQGSAADDAAAKVAARALVTSLAREPARARNAARTAAREQNRASGDVPPGGLPIPPALAAPAPRTRFRFPQGDSAGAAARSIARRVAHFYNFRAQIPGAEWRADETARFAIRAQRTCLTELQRLGIKAHPVERPLTTPVPVPVVIDAPIGGVAFVSLHADRAVEVSCELAVRLESLARILRAHGVLAVGVNSSYRDQPKVSFHTFGLALDLAAFRTRERTLLVAKHFEPSPLAHTCEATPATSEGKALLALACAIADSHRFSSVLTPNYNEGHRDHFHLDIRPDDPRLFLR